MSDRRKAPRFAFSSPARAQLYVAHDVQIHRNGPEQLTVVSSVGSPNGEELALRLCRPDGTVVTLTVCTIGSRPIVDDSGVRYQIDLRVCGTGEAQTEAWSWGGGRGDQ